MSDDISDIMDVRVAVRKPEAYVDPEVDRKGDILLTAGTYAGTAKEFKDFRKILSEANENSYSSFFG
jgi:hypothetical protein